VVKHVLCDEGGINNAYVGGECVSPFLKHWNALVSQGLPSYDRAQDRTATALWTGCLRAG